MASCYRRLQNWYRGCFLPNRKDRARNSDEQGISREEAHSNVLVVSNHPSTVTLPYQTTERESLAVVTSLAEVRWLVQGAPFPTMFTDRQALTKTLKSEDLTGKMV